MDYKERKQARKKARKKEREKEMLHRVLNPGKLPFAAENKQVLMPFGKY